MLNVDCTTGQRSQKVDLGVVEQIVAFALEAWVRLLLNLELDVTWLHTRHLVSLSAEVNLGAILNTLVNVNVEDLSLDDGLLAVALLASVLIADGLSLSVAVGADSLETLDHGTHLAHHGLHTGTVAALTGLYGTLLASSAITLRADDRLLQSELRDLAAVDVFQGDLVYVVDGSRLLWSLISHAASKHAAEATASAAEELGEEVLGSHATTAHSSLLETLLSILIVELTLLRV